MHHDETCLDYGLGEAELFLMGVIVFTVFAAGFLLSINRFLVKRSGTSEGRGGSHRAPC